MWLDVTPRIAATACHQSNDVERYRRYRGAGLWAHRRKRPYHIRGPAHAATARRAYPSTIVLRGTDGMASLTACTDSQGAHARSRQLIRVSRTFLTEVQEVLQDARQRYRQIVCAWCQQTIRWERCAPDAWGQSSHSMGFECFAGVFPELAPGTLPPPSVHGGTVR